ncbi:hypothetical protein BT96DRAFT_1002768 [Gymnopus androsaceus JB14]|uniref:UAS domain-containing protein n=1 Tax=Gymnopus androsaceus JB14 TaxID=1447944 RepID=A0A6A4GY25_9AGAR|nr:hypothetical protein BT96DRAFT_1002768 [Gymnopus androsaceus JB14]
MSSQNSTLTPSQTHTLTQLQDLTNTTRGDNSDELISVLTTVDWNVERAAEPRHSPSPITQVLTYPLHILSSLFRFIFTLLRLQNPIPYIPLLSLNPWSQGGGWDWTNLGRGELEEETGGVCANSTISSSDFTDVGDSTGIARKSRITPRHTSSSASNGTNGQPLLPLFASGSYNSILCLCSSPQNPKIEFIVLVSSEHTPDDAVFKNQTLANKELVDILSEEVLGSDEGELGRRDEEGLFICWGRDIVQDKDAYDASMKIGMTTFPFVAFVTLQGRGFSAAATGSSTTANDNPSSCDPLPPHWFLSLYLPSWKFAVKMLRYRDPNTGSTSSQRKAMKGQYLLAQESQSQQCVG